MQESGQDMASKEGPWTYTICHHPSMGTTLWESPGTGYFLQLCVHGKGFLPQFTTKEYDLLVWA